jgi:hypothetical protein
MLNRLVCQGCDRMGDTVLPTDPSDIKRIWLCWNDEVCAGNPVKITDEKPPNHCPHKDEHLNPEK